MKGPLVAVAAALVGILTCLAVVLVLILTANASSQRSPAVFSVGRVQAGQVAAIVDFVNAWKTRDLSKALALLAPGAAFSDCDYRTHRVVIRKGKSQIAGWLRKRFADRDVLTIRRIGNENPNENRVASVDYERRTSRLFPEGMTPKLSAKVVFRSDGRIVGFANGPGGASPDQQARVCSP
jgi:hypothetical protein